MAAASASRQPSVVVEASLGGQHDFVAGHLFQQICRDIARLLKGASSEDITHPLGLLSLQHSFSKV